ncbi:glycosyl hydrolases family 31-domain-containing protein [Aspergillus pseudoustus]|uniref:Glycosyl hydrolases family 31-domain-containing protein n=1 Tax=Aspergillus pseudoustus TaxID=1810923 RepID=A0ABR4KFQ1_9EURO
MLYPLLLCLCPLLAHAARFTLTHDPHTSIIVENPAGGIVNNSAIIAGSGFSRAFPVSRKDSGISVNVRSISPATVKVDVASTDHAFVGANFTGDAATFWGVWEQPYTEGITNNGFNETLRGPNIGIDGMATARAPFFISSDGYGIYADSIRDASFNFTDSSAGFLFNSSAVTYYIIVADGPGDFKSIYREYARLSNTINLFAVSGYGPTFWTDDSTYTANWPKGVTNALEYHENLADILHTNNIHAASMFIDRPWGTGTMGWGNFDWDPEFFPNPRQFFANMSSRGYDIMAWVANRANEDTLFYNTSREHRWLWDGPDVNPGNSLGPAVNLSNPDTYGWVKDHLLNVSRVGLKGYKIDRGDENEFPDWAQHEQNALMAQLTYEVMKELYGPCQQGKPCHSYTFVRSAHDKSRQHVGLWNGDTGAGYDGLRMSVRSAIRAGLINFPIWGSDTGGYSGQRTVEVWASWMWFSCFSPVYELKIGKDNNPWDEQWAPEMMPVLKKTTDLHHELVPFIQSYAYRSTKDGVPIVRALFLEVPQDTTAVAAVDDAYFFGEELLVYNFIEEGSHRSIYFPTGSRYVEYLGNSSTVYQGGSTIDFKRDSNSPPVFVKEGSIVPRGDIYRANNRWDPDWKPHLTVEIFPSYQVSESRFSYYVESLGRATTIEMATSRKQRCVTVHHGPLGADATLLMYSKAGKRSIPLPAKGGKVVLKDVISLFD